ncbi:hypothetical protein [Paenibacillus ferrarius]|uniref:hypothetical protein n=1 Tax=Paenibacillus ferrarius TaxID=1469647 RepID=UPI003D277E36
MSFWRKMAGTTSVKLLLAAAIVVSWLPMKAVPAFAADTAIVNDDFSTYSLGALTLGSGNGRRRGLCRRLMFRMILLRALLMARSVFPRQIHRCLLISGSALLRKPEAC